MILSRLFWIECLNNSAIKANNKISDISDDVLESFDNLKEANLKEVILDARAKVLIIAPEIMDIDIEANKNRPWHLNFRIWYSH